MNDIKIFRVEPDTVEQLPGKAPPVEKNLHSLIEKHLEKFFSVTPLRAEYPTGRTHKGFIDTIGIDSDGCPVIIEYKRKTHENIITQGLFYLDWLFDHKAEFTSLVKEKLGGESAAKIDFLNARLICIAASFSRFDERAIMQIDRSIALVRYEFFGDNLLLFEATDNFISPFSMESQEAPTKDDTPGIGLQPALQARFKNMDPDIEQLYLALLGYVEEIGEDITIKFLKHYIALEREKNFTWIQPQRKALKLWLNLDPDDVTLEEGFSRDVRNVGHHSSGDIEVELKSYADLEKVKPLILLAYNQD